MPGTVLWDRAVAKVQVLLRRALRTVCNRISAPVITTSDHQDQGARQTDCACCHLLAEATGFRMTMPTIIERTIVYEGWYRFSRILLQWHDGVTFERHLLDNGSAVSVLPYDPIRRVCLLVSQPRAPVIAAGEPPLLEAVAGNLESCNAATQTRKEAAEEAGVLLNVLEPVAHVWSLCAVSTERIQLFLAPYTHADQTGSGGGAPDEDEWITVHEIGLDRLRTLAESGELQDAKTLILAQALMLRHPALW